MGTETRFVQRADPGRKPGVQEEGTTPEPATGKDTGPTADPGREPGVSGARLVGLVGLPGFKAIPATATRGSLRTGERLPSAVRAPALPSGAAAA